MCKKYDAAVVVHQLARLLRVCGLIYCILFHRTEVSQMLCVHQVVIEGVVEGQSLGDIAVDDIKILEINTGDCKGESAIKLIKISLHVDLFKSDLNKPKI